MDHRSSALTVRNICEVILQKIENNFMSTLSCAELFLEVSAASACPPSPRNAPHSPKQGLLRSFRPGTAVSLFIITLDQDLLGHERLFIKLLCESPPLDKERWLLATSSTPLKSQPPTTPCNHWLWPSLWSQFSTLLSMKLSEVRLVSSVLEDPRVFL
jgi:hypothetical protein